jgi:hypothetical protein
MTKNIENKFNRIVENSDPQELEDKLVMYTNKAIDDVFMNENKNDGLNKMNTTVKFFQDHQHTNPNIYNRASKRINNHLFDILSKSLEDTVKSYQNLKNLMQFVMVIDLMFYNLITDSINIYKKDKKESDLRMNIDNLNELKRIKIKILNLEIFQDALTEFEEMIQEDPDFQGYENIHKETVKDLKKNIQESNPKSDKKNIQ